MMAVLVVMVDDIVTKEDMTMGRDIMITAVVVHSGGHGHRGGHCDGGGSDAGGGGGGGDWNHSVLSNIAIALAAPRWSHLSRGDMS